MRPPEGADDPLDSLVAAIGKSTRYRRVCPGVVRRIGAQELARRKSWKEAEKETRNRLHHIAGAYLDSVPPYDTWLNILRAAPNAETYHAEIKRMMRCHASTRERLPILEEFYQRTLASIQPVQSVLDVACGFNPLALPWMGIEDAGTYYGCDLYADMASFLVEAARRSVEHTSEP